MGLGEVLVVLRSSSSNCAVGLAELGEQPLAPESEAEEEELSSEKQQSSATDFVDSFLIDFLSNFSGIFSGNCCCC